MTLTRASTAGSQWLLGDSVAVGGPPLARACALTLVGWCACVRAGVGVCGGWGIRPGTRRPPACARECELAGLPSLGRARPGPLLPFVGLSKRADFNLDYAPPPPPLGNLSAAELSLLLSSSHSAKIKVP